MRAVEHRASGAHTGYDVYDKSSWICNNSNRIQTAPQKQAAPAHPEPQKARTASSASSATPKLGQLARDAVKAFEQFLVASHFRRGRFAGE